MSNSENRRYNIGIAVTLLLSCATMLWSCAPSRKVTVAPKPAPPLAPSSTTIPQPPPAAPEAPVHISVAYPVPGQYRPNVASNFIFGTVGNGNASLIINGTTVPLAKNGAFLAFLPMPPDGMYHLMAQRGDDIDSMTVAYRSGSSISTIPSTPHREEEHKIFTPGIAQIKRGSDTLQTGSDVAPGAPTPDGDRKWFFPRGARLDVIAQEGKYYKVELEKGVEAWVADSNFDLHASERPTQEVHSGGMFPQNDFVDLVFPSNYNPFLITPQGTSITVRLYGKSNPHAFNTSTTDPLINNIGFDSTGRNTEYTVLLSKPVWGYKAFYTNDGSLDVRIRRPPKIDPNNPLHGLRIMIDPGHPPGGAIGPTGLTEREANMAVATRLRDQLTAKGATVLMTHSTLSGLVSDYDQVEELEARVALAIRENVDLMVSVHNNAFPDGTDPFQNNGTSTYYYHPFSAALAADLDHEIAPVTGIPNLGSQQKSLAICRPTWMPCALTESLVMMFPDQEQALRDPKFLDDLAQAHVRGIEDFVRERAQ
ncbi:MAG TPA: N-acetylmuramoyl-L-alanine amidase [Candidatus Kapabacteria bacterium]|nr:N-acetylmuramoyl-L-alanine amidase [Candidatus Kapabacteria bacterium]